MTQEFPMLFASTHPALRRNVYAHAHASRSLERFLSDAQSGTSQSATRYQQDETAFHLTLDLPGIAREQLAISIEGAVVRIVSKEDAPRQYRAAYELPQDIDAAQSGAKLENGVLSLKLAKKIPVTNATELTIQ
jgi:HSP20 family molecular chaperone IbpA